MKSNQIIFLLLLLLIAGLLTFRISYSYFSDSGSSTENILAASAEFPQPTPQIANHIVISEVQTSGGTGGGASKLTDRDFIELYNPTAEAIDLGEGNYRLAKRIGSGVPTSSNIDVFDSGNVIPAHGYFLWASSESPGYSSTINADASSSATLAITNNSIALLQGTLETGTIIDALSWSSVSGSYTEGTRFTPDLDANESMERKAYSSSTASSMGSGGLDETKGNGFDANNNLTDFYIRAASQPQNSSVTETP